MYEAFLSFHQIKDYLSVLTKKGLIEYQRGDMTYRITDKGKDILEKM
jgi:predicted transcriptional regulator